MYQVFITPSARREAKKLPAEVKIVAIEATKRLENNPYLGKKLSGPLAFIYSLHFKVRGRD